MADLITSPLKAEKIFQLVEKEELRFNKKNLIYYHWLEDGGVHEVEVQEVCRTESCLQQTACKETASVLQP